MWRPAKVLFADILCSDRSTGRVVALSFHKHEIVVTQYSVLNVRKPSLRRSLTIDSVLCESTFYSGSASLDFIDL
jgi:hypothetical protein